MLLVIVRHDTQHNDTQPKGVSVIIFIVLKMSNVMLMSL